MFRGKYYFIVAVGGKTVMVEIARTLQEREKGLSERKNLCVDCGMPFVFDQLGIYTFWMGRMYFDVDVLWIADDRIVDITLGVKKPLVADFDSPKIIYQSQVRLIRF